MPQGWTSPVSPPTDMNKILDALRTLFHRSPDMFADAKAAIDAVCGSVRGWWPNLACAGHGQYGRYRYVSAVVEFTYGFPDGAEKLVFHGIGTGHPGPPSKQVFSQKSVALTDAHFPKPLLDKTRSVLERFLLSGSFVHRAAYRSRACSTLGLSVAPHHRFEIAIDGAAINLHHDLFLPSHVPRMLVAHFGIFRPKAGYIQEIKMTISTTVLQLRGTSDVRREVLSSLLPDIRNDFGARRPLMSKASPVRPALAGLAAVAGLAAARRARPGQGRGDTGRLGGVDRSLLQLLTSAIATGAMARQPDVPLAK